MEHSNKPRAPEAKSTRLPPSAKATEREDDERQTRPAPSDSSTASLATDQSANLPPESGQGAALNH